MTRRAGGRKRSLPLDKVQQVITRATRPPAGRSRWSVRSLAKVVGISHDSVRRIWQEHDIKPHLTRTFKLSADPLFEEKFWDVIGLYLNPPAKALALCCDEKSQCQALERIPPGLPLGMGHICTRTHDYERHGTITLFAALSYLEGKRLSRTEARPPVEWLRFLKQIDRETPKELPIHLIVDNYCTHQNEVVKQWLAKHPRFRMHFTPAGSSWMNWVERFFRELTEDVVREGSFGSVGELVRSIEQYLAARNADPKTYRWKAKGEEILAKSHRARAVLKQISAESVIKCYLQDSTLARTGQARLVKVGDAGIKHFIRTGVVDASDFVPADIGTIYSGLGAFSVVKFEKRAHDAKCVIEGVLRLPEKPLSTSSRDLLFLTLSANNRKLNLVADMNLASPSTTGGYWAYEVVSRPQTMTPEWEKLLGKPGGSYFPQTRIRLLPNLGSAYDLYACGLLCLRCLLAHDGQSIFATLEELYKLADAVSRQGSPPAELPQRIHQLLETERAALNTNSEKSASTWLEALGPHRLLDSGVSMSDVVNHTPLMLWSRCLALALRLFPGLVPESYARDLGDSDAEAPELIYRQPLHELERIIADVRRLLLHDWNMNRDVHKIITDLLGLKT